MIRKILKISFSEKVLAVLSVLAIILALIPLYRLTFYAVPRYDDFGYGINLWKEQRYGYGLYTIIKAGYDTALGSHYSWQGTYSSIFMMAQMPAALGFQYYFIGPVLLITSLVVSTLFLTSVLSKVYLNASRCERTIFSVIVTLTLTECIYTAQQGFYWYNSGVHYVFMHSIMFVFVSFMVLLTYTKKTAARFIYFLIVTALAFVCAGANFVTCIQGILLLTGYIVVLLFRDARKTLWYLPAFFVYMFGLRLNLFAPGNAHRQASYQGESAARAIIDSLKEGVVNAWKFSGPFVIILMIIAIPVICKMVKKTEFKFRLPGLFSLLSYCFYCTGYTSSFYSMGSAGLSRTWIAVCFSFQILLFANEVYWIGYLSHKRLKPFSLTSDYYPAFYLMALIMMLVSFHYTQDKIGAVSSFGAYYYIHTGEAYAFHEEFLERVNIFEESDHGVVDVPEYAYKPWFLINRDISDDPSQEENRMMSEYFGLQGLRAVPRDEYYGK